MQEDHQQELPVHLTLIDFHHHQQQQDYPNGDPLHHLLQTKLRHLQKTIKKFRLRSQQFHGFIPIEFYNNLQYALMIYNQFPSSIDDSSIPIAFSERIRSNREFIKARLRRNPELLFSDQYYQFTLLQNDVEMIKTVISQPNYGYLLEKASPHLRFDPELMKIADELGGYKSNGQLNHFLWYDSWMELNIHEKEEREIVKKMLSRNADMFSELSVEHRSDRELALIAIQSDPSALCYVSSDELNRDRSFILQALKSRQGVGLRTIINCPNCQFLFIELFYKFGWHLDSEILLTVAKEHFNLFMKIISFSSSEISVDGDSGDGDGGKVKSYDWQNDDEFCMELVLVQPTIIDRLPKRFISNRENVLKIVKSCGIALKGLNSFSNDREIVWEAIRNNSIAYQFASETLKQDRELIMLSLKGSSPQCAFHSMPAHFKEDAEICLQALQSGLNFHDIKSRNLLYNREFILSCCKISKIPYSAIQDYFSSLNQEQQPQQQHSNEILFEMLCNFIKYNQTMSSFKYENLPAEFVTNCDENQKLLLLSLIEKIYPKVIVLLPEELIQDEEFCLEYIKRNENAILHLKIEKGKRVEFIRKAVEVNEGILKHLNHLFPAWFYGFANELSDRYGIFGYKYSGSEPSKEGQYKRRMEAEYPGMMQMMENNQ